MYYCGIAECFLNMLRQCLNEQAFQWHWDNWDLGESVKCFEYLWIIICNKKIYKLKFSTSESYNIFSRLIIIK